MTSSSDIVKYEVDIKEESTKEEENVVTSSIAGELVTKLDLMKFLKMKDKENNSDSDDSDKTGKLNNIYFYL